MVSTPAPTRTSSNSEPVDIVLVEDNPGDVRLIEEAFKEANIDQTHRVFTNGSDALNHLREGADPTYPDLVLLDLDLPGKDGCEILELIRNDSKLECLPVIILTGSEASEDVERCYRAHANAYVTKPSRPDEFVSIAESLERFWIEHVELPPVPR